MLSGSLELSVLLHQLLQAEAWKLYRNLGFFAFSFALVDRALTVFWMADPLAGAKSALTCGFFDRSRLGHGELLAAAREEFGNVFNRIVGPRSDSRFCGTSIASTWVAAVPRRALVFIFVRIVRALGIVGSGASSRGTAEGCRSHPSFARSQFFNERRRHFFQEAGWHAGFGQVRPVAAAVNCSRQDQLIHGASHADITKAALFLNIFRDEHCARVREESLLQPAEKHKRKLQTLG